MMRHSLAWLSIVIGFAAIGLLVARALRLQRNRRRYGACIWCGAREGEVHERCCRTEPRR
jgi:hypothetical protein